MQRFAALLGLLLFLPPAISEGASTQRYLWLVRDDLSSTSSIDRMLELAVESDATGIIAQVVGGAEAYYDSGVLPVVASAVAFDPLEYLVTRGRPLGLEIHAWVNAFLVWSAPHPPSNPAHVWHTRPEWFMCDRAGRSTSLYTRAECEAASIVGATLSPARPEVRALLAEVACEIAENYDVDGIHLDYIRYPNSSFGFESTARVGFHSREAVDPRDLVTPRFGVDINLLNETFGRAWSDWRRDRVTETVATVRSALRSRSPSMLLSCAVMADPFGARDTYLCDWPDWLYRDLVDFVCPMAYTTSQSRAIELAMTEIAESPEPFRIIHGIGVYNQSVASASAGAREALRLGAGGICVFSLNALSEGSAASLRSVWGSGSPGAHRPETSLLHQVWGELPRP